MAITIAQNSDHKSLTGKTLSVQSTLTSKLKSTIVDVTYGASDNYATNGNTVDLSLGGRIRTVIGATILHSNKGLLLQYAPAAAGAAATGKIKAYGHTPTSATATVIALEELDNADTAVNSMTIRIVVTGF
tara:strand:- start:1838 stop:2230 length:393 start_codon:yes stop_codon:yes gene_type:complete